MKIAIAAVLFAVSFSAAADERECSDILIESGMFETQHFQTTLEVNPIGAARIVASASSSCEAIKRVARVGGSRKSVELLADKQEKDLTDGGMPADVAASAKRIILLSFDYAQ